MTKPKFVLLTTSLEDGLESKLALDNKVMIVYRLPLEVGMKSHNLTLPGTSTENPKSLPIGLDMESRYPSKVPPIQGSTYHVCIAA